MKYITFLFLLILSCTFLNAQEIKIEDIITNLKEGNVQKAKEISDKSVLVSTLSQSPKTWYYRAVTYQNMYENSDQKINTLSDEPLFEAYNSFVKTLLLDSKKEYNSDIIKALRIIASQFVYEGIQFFNSANYVKALAAFENNLKINKMPEINQIDTIIMYNAALAAEKTGETAKAIDYYSQLIVFGFSGSKMYLDLALLYKKTGKEEEYFKTINNGMKAYPNDDINLVSELINHYLEKGDNENAFIWVEKGLTREPKNPAFHFVKGSLTDQKGDFINAEKEYKSALEFDPEYSDALFNLGVLYYNNATDIIKKATNKDEQNKALGLYANAQPYLEKILTQTPDDVQIMKMLKTTYTLLKQDEKLSEINKKLEKSQ